MCCSCGNAPSPLLGRYPKGAVEDSITALEACRPDYPRCGAIRAQIDVALYGLYRFREIETGEPSPVKS